MWNQCWEYRLGRLGLVGTSFGWDSASQCQTSRHMEKLDVFGEHVTTAFTGATRFIDIRFASVISPKITF